MIRRSKLEVLVDIIKAIAEEERIRRTRVMFKANLSWNVLKEALEFLERKGVIAFEKAQSGTYLTLTNKGYALLRLFSELENALAPEPEPPLAQAPSSRKPLLRSYAGAPLF
jgi:predicted transcriptional regulator